MKNNLYFSTACLYRQWRRIRFYSATIHRDFYRYISSQKKDAQGIPPLIRKNGKGTAQSDLEKAEEFNGQFTE